MNHASSDREGLQPGTGFGRPIVHLPTRTVVGYSIEPAESRHLDRLERLVTDLSDTPGLTKQGPTRLHILSWSPVVGRWLRHRPEQVRQSADHGLTIELPDPIDQAEFGLALHLSEQAQLPLSVRFTGEVTPVVTLHDRGLLRVVRIPGVHAVRDGSPDLGTRLGQQLVKALTEGDVTVIVDGVTDQQTATRLRRAGVRFGQGPVFDTDPPSPFAELRRSGTAPISMDESERLAMVHAAEILDTRPDPAFQSIVRLVSERCRLPIAAISIIDVDRQWFQASVGLEVRETPRDHAFCAHTILSEGPLIVPDALADPIFQSNPLVIGSPFIRAYLGVPLRASNGMSFGSLCAIDTEPRRFHHDEISDVVSLARLITDALELRAR